MAHNQGQDISEVHMVEDMEDQIEEIPGMKEEAVEEDLETGAEETAMVAAVDGKVQNLKTSKRIIISR